MAKNIRLLVVAGGGSGGGSTDSGGGGAGGMQDVASQPIESQDYTITVGAGGISSNGGNSSFGSLLISTGGGRGGTGGGSNDGVAGSSGGSGGGGEGANSGDNEGAGGSGIAGQGYAGAAGREGNSLGPPNDRDAVGGGGGGAGSIGSIGGDHTGGNGGSGATSNITGASATYSVGGGGNGPDGNGTGGAATANTGNGGTNGNGQSGVVIVRYPTAQFGKCTGGTITTSGSDTIHTFTASGTFSVSDVITLDTTNIDFETATANGNAIQATGATIIERGFVWSTSTNPTTALSTKVIVSGTSGTYSGSMTDLSPNTLYYVRAYSIDSDDTTTYGENVTFTTLSIEPNSLYKNINAEDGATYAVSVDIGGTTGTVTVKLGSTGYSEVFNAGEGTITLEGEYSGLNGLIFEASNDFDGTIDNVFWVLIVGTATIDWDLNTLTNIFPINSSVIFKRFEDKNFNRFRIYRYLDIQFKDQDAYVTVLLKKEANESAQDSTKEFLVSNTSDEVLPFINKKISMLTKNQAIRIGLSNNRISETFTVCQFVITGYDQQRGTFDSDKIVSM